MLKRLFLLFPLLIFYTVPAAADEVKLTAAEIEALLAGNTIAGDWGGKYQQYYAKDGFTMYLPEGGDNSPGKWRVNPANNMYESWWESTGWTPYAIARVGDVYFWIDDKGEKHPFKVMPGKQVDW